MTTNIDITITADQSAFLLESLGWSIGAAAKALDRGTPQQRERARAKYAALDDVLAQLQHETRGALIGFVA